MTHFFTDADVLSVWNIAVFHLDKYLYWSLYIWTGVVQKYKDQLLSSHVKFIRILKWVSKIATHARQQVYCCFFVISLENYVSSFSLWSALLSAPFISIHLIKNKNPHPLLSFRFPYWRRCSAPTSRSHGRVPNSSFWGAWRRAKAVRCNA